MRFRAGGILFSVEPEEALTEEDRASIARVDTGEGGPPQTPVRLEIVAEPPWKSSDARLYPGRDQLPVQRWENGRLLVSHHSFTAEIDPSAAWARLHRTREHTYPLGVVIRTTMLARLPLLGGLPLHAAGVVLGGRSLAFFGPSGAGKTTLAESYSGTVLSDELVAMTPGEPLSLERSGYWGEGRERGGPAGAPLAALVALDRGPSFVLRRLETRDAVRCIVDAVPVPLAAPLWSQALAVTADAVSRIPVYRMEWTPGEPPWGRLAEALARG